MDFDGFLNYPPDCFERQSLCPFVVLGRQESNDAEGEHTFTLRRLKPSVTAMLAAVPESGIEQFCRQWSEHWIYSPFQGWEHVSPEVAREKCREAAFEKLNRFFHFFHPLCQDACATGRAIYILWERHDTRPA